MRAIAIRTRHSQHLTPELSDSDRPVSIVSVFLHKTCICSLIASFTFTGWTYQAQDKQQRTLGLGKSKPSSRNLISSKTSGRFSVHGVPYSEHSSFPVSIVKCATIVLMIYFRLILIDLYFQELLDCISCLHPKKIIPTVSVSKSEEQVQLLLDAI